jgi:hypothetical protein
MSNTPAPVVVTPKPFWESKTNWVNGLTVLAMILTFVLDTSMAGGLPFNLDARWIALGLGVINIWLRSITNQPVTRGKA